MKTLATLFLIALTTGALLSHPAGATILTINGSDFTNGLNNQIINGIDWTSSPGNFNKKTVAGFTGVGITGGRTNDEIDIQEFLTGSILPGGLPFWVPSFTLGVLFDGPEFNDVQEVARVGIWRLSQPGPSYYTLTNNYEAIPPGPDTAVWSGPGSVTNLSPSIGSGGAVWRITNPFGSINDIYKIEFTALAGVSADICGSSGTDVCKNQSDFTLVQFQYEPVPEPGTHAMLGLGLIGIGLLARRRRA